jgi:hypothetical protein
VDVGPAEQLELKEVVSAWHTDESSVNEECRLLGCAVVWLL